jgi:hypothetical protein
MRDSGSDEEGELAVAGAVRDPAASCAARDLEPAASRRTPIATAIRFCALVEIIFLARKLTRSLHHEGFGKAGQKVRAIESLPLLCGAQRLASD